MRADTAPTRRTRCHARDVGAAVRSLSAADEVDDLDLVPFVHRGRVVSLTLDDFHVVLDRDETGIDVEMREQGCNRERAGDLVAVPIQLYRQSLSQRLPTPTSAS